MLLLFVVVCLPCLLLCGLLVRWLCVRSQISGGAMGDVRIWEMRSRELVSDLKEHVGAVTGIVRAPEPVATPPPPPLSTMTILFLCAWPTCG
jgi:hypothetical protein